MVLPSWVPDDETKPAPMPLLVVQSFVNTREADSGTDMLADLEPARQWLGDAGLLDDVEDVDLVMARELREAIRALLVHNGGGEAPGGSTLDALGSLAETCRLRPVILAGGSVDLRPDAEAGTSALGRLLLIIRDTQRDGTWQRLKACRNPELPVGLLRPLPRGPRRVVRHGGVRQPDQEPQPPLATVGCRRVHRPDGLPVSRTVRIDVEDKVGTLALDNVGKRNALGVETVQELMDALGDFEERGVHAVVLRAAELTDVWSAGHDIDELPVRGVDPLPFADPLEELLRAVRGYPGAVIAMVHGTVWGGACDLVLNCDMVVGDDTAAFAVTPARLGLPYSASGIQYFLARLPINVVNELIIGAACSSGWCSWSD